MAIVAYVRVSTHEQNLELQIEAMERHGYDMLYQEAVSGAKADRPQFEKCLNYLRKGDTLVVWRLDRFGRTLRRTLELVEELESKGVQFKSLLDKFDTSTASGRMFFHLCAVFAEYERNIMLERTYAGLAAAKAQGRVGGRKRSMSPGKIAKAVDLHNRGVSAKDIAAMMKCSKSTVFKYLQEEKLKSSK
jgi:DNA invertase Pin-like site-specific DNA recombinase